jgi:hypothetical protein
MTCVALKLGVVIVELEPRVAIVQKRRLGELSAVAVTTRAIGHHLPRKLPRVRIGMT